MSNSRIDHVYITDKIKTSTPMHLETAYSDHQLITFDIMNLNNMIEERQADRRTEQEKLENKHKQCAGSL
jgi:hypothetical protein